MNKRSVIALAVISVLWNLTMAEMKSSVTFSSLTAIQFDITYTFDKQYECGQYANGDWWVVADGSTQKVVITRITPDYSNGLNGWTVNPSEQGKQPYDNRTRLTFDATLMPGLPYDAKSGESIVKIASVSASQTTCKNCAQNGAVLTVLAQAPVNPATTFRPPFAGDYKPEFFSTDLQTQLLPSLATVPGAITKESAENRVKVMRLDYSSAWAMPDHKPQDSGPAWGGDMMRSDTEVFFWMCLNHSVADKMNTLIGMVQYGIDLFGARKSLGTTWVHGGGGNGAGRLLPFSFAATMLNSGEMKQELAKSTVFAEYNNTFWEHEMFSRSPRTGEVYWGYWNPWCSEETYWKCLAVDPNIAKTIKDPYQYIDGTGYPGESYQGCVSLPVKYTALILHLIPELQTAWPETNIRIFDYADRWVKYGVAIQNDPCAPAPELTSAQFDSKESHGYGTTWGPDPNNSGDCIRDTDPSDGWGRFPELDGKYINSAGLIAGRKSNFGEFMWNMYRETAGVGDRRQDSEFRIQNPAPFITISPQPCRNGQPVLVLFDQANTKGFTVIDARGTIVQTIKNPDRVRQWIPQNLKPGIYYLQPTGAGATAGVQRIAVIE